MKFKYKTVHRGLPLPLWGSRQPEVKLILLHNIKSLRNKFKIETVGGFEIDGVQDRRGLMYLMTEQEGRMGTHLAHDDGVPTKHSEICED